MWSSNPLVSAHTQLHKNAQKPTACVRLHNLMSRQAVVSSCQTICWFCITDYDAYSQCGTQCSSCRLKLYHLLCNCELIDHIYGCTQLSARTLCSYIKHLFLLYHSIKNSLTQEQKQDGECIEDSNTVSLWVTIFDCKDIAQVANCLQAVWVHLWLTAITLRLMKVCK